ncbi:MAG: M23 family metallopeptidase [Bacilli bacterium]|nr:M23 family metallopeptidase [Bacilli bacterium]MBR3209018.1 M23 family metallopeptidase [Bacilli bacterium]
MTERRLKKEVIYTICISALLLLIGIIYYADYSNKKLKEQNDESYTYVSKLFDTNIKAVVSTPKKIIKPYDNENTKIIKEFYNYKDQEEKQENSIINYDTTYIQNNGIIYGQKEVFDAIAILDGKVISIKEDNLLGKIVTVKHNNNIETTYKCLSEVNVNENEIISQGTIIGKSGASNIEKDTQNILLFEMTKDQKYINPENTYDKQIDEING